MKTTTRLLALAGSTLLTLGLAGCAGHRGMGMGMGMGMGGSQAPAQGDMASMDLQAMCEMHRSLMSGKPPAEQQAMMQQHMKSMSAEMRQRMQAMHARCS